ncbi:hypothetical protein SASPL_117605 [Salvia splendens]|uniref:Ectonucleotide pyrophosphatase/phosphodiesterase family member 1/3 n=1 Tax=Salvia splendens TaxID=180675 RepID=A0A8X8XVA1_SALSN|nr:hypothetical protein SASPL_117605 [Salvia splendens]
MQRTVRSDQLGHYDHDSWLDQPSPSWSPSRSTHLIDGLIKPSPSWLIKPILRLLTGLIPVFPTPTFPNHYSIITGLYPAYHGIVNNFFTDPATGDFFTMSSHEPKWWLGEPLGETLAIRGLKASTYFWPGSEVVKGSWNCSKEYCMIYNSSVPYEDRVDTVLRYFDLNSSEIPSFMTLYFEDPDHQGHKVGSDDPKITEAMISDDLGIPKDWIQSYSPLLAIRPPSDHSPKEVVAKMNEALKSGNSDRIPPVIGLVDEGFKVEQTRLKRQECGGSHGYDNAIFCMRSVFISHGPRFGRGRKLYPGARVANHAMCSDEYCSLWGMAADSNDRMEFFQERDMGWVSSTATGEDRASLQKLFRLLNLDLIGDFLIDSIGLN